MEFGSELDDDLFETPREKKEDAPLSYQAKICEKQWFQRNSHTSDGEELVCLKHEADYLYFRKIYKLAEIVYKQCLEKVPISNNTGKRDCIEGVARSLLNQGKTHHALEWAVKLHATSYNIDQRIVSWSLLAEIYHKLKMYQEELSALQSCIQVHPWNSDFWLQLAFCYVGCFGINLLCNSSHMGSFTPSVNCFGKKEHNLLCNESLLLAKNEDLVSVMESKIQDTNALSCRNTEQMNETDSTLKSKIHCCKDKCSNNCMSDVCDKMTSCHLKTHAKEGLFFTYACLVRTRLLLQGCYSGHRSFGKRKNALQQKMLSEYIENLQVDKTFRDLAVQMLSRDIASEFQDVSEENEIADTTEECNAKKKNTDSSNLTRNLFEAHWFSWIQDYFAGS